MDQRGYPDTYLQRPFTILLDARVHCAVLKVRRVAPHPPPPDPGTEPERYDRHEALREETNPTPPASQRQGRPVPSGPNSVPTADVLRHRVPRPPEEEPY